MQLQYVTDIDSLAQFLRHYPVENAFELGYLDPAYADTCEWFARTDDDGIRTLMLLYTGLSRPALFFVGHPDGVTPLLRHYESELPERVFVRSPRGLFDAVKTMYEPTGEIRQMERMGLNRSTFLARDTGEEIDNVEPLTHKDTGAIMETYAVWPDHFFDPYQLSSGLYFGIRGENDDIASIAGIHNLSEQYDVAAIGNLVTHTDYRGRGYAHRCTVTLLRRLFERVGLVALDVQSGNVAAIRTYQRFGFKPHAEFFEGEMQLKG